MPHRFTLSGTEYFAAERTNADGLVTAEQLPSPHSHVTIIPLVSIRP